MLNERCWQPLDSMERITWSELCDDLDRLLARINAENIGFVIKDDTGKDSLVICPAFWVDDGRIKDVCELQTTLEAPD
jgi:hypothetical protein